MTDPIKSRWGFHPLLDCENCLGTGDYTDKEPCHFCMSDAIRRGELDGVADDIHYRGGKRLYFRTLLSVEVLSEAPILPGMDISDIVHEMSDGDYVGSASEMSVEEVDGPTMAQLLTSLGSEPGFFQLDNEGNALEGDEDE